MLNGLPRLTRPSPTPLPDSAAASPTGRPESALASQHLLAGHLECGSCGGSVFVAPRVKHGVVTRYWLCTSYHKLGTKRCANHHAVPYDRLTQAILGCFRDISAEMVVQAMIAEWERRTSEWESGIDSRSTQEDEVKRLSVELERLVSAVAAVGGSPALLSRLRETEARLVNVRAKLEAPWRLTATGNDGSSRQSRMFSKA